MRLPRWEFHSSSWELMRSQRFCAGSSTAPSGADEIPAASVRGQAMPGEGVHGQAQHCHGASLTRRVRELANSFVSFLLTLGYSMGCDHSLHEP